MYIYAVLYTLFFIVIVIFEYLCFLFYSREFPLILMKVYKLRYRIMFLVLLFLYASDSRDSFTFLCIKMGILILFVLPYWLLSSKLRTTFYFNSTDLTYIDALLYKIGDEINVYDFYSVCQMKKDGNVIIKIEFLNLKKDVRKHIIRKLYIETKGSLKNIKAYYWIEFFMTCCIYLGYLIIMYALL